MVSKSNLDAFIVGNAVLWIFFLTLSFRFEKISEETFIEKIDVLRERRIYSTQQVSSSISLPIMQGAIAQHLAQLKAKGKLLFF